MKIINKEISKIPFIKCNKDTNRMKMKLKYSNSSLASSWVWRIMKFCRQGITIICHRAREIPTLKSKKVHS